MLSSAASSSSASAQPKESSLSLLLACNVYVTAGQKSSHERILLQLLRQAQSMCMSISAASDDNAKSGAENNQHGIIEDDSFLSCLPPTSLEQQQPRLLSLLSTEKRRLLPSVMMVHAYTDAVYNRSSFHLAGTNAGDAIVKVASTLAISAIQMLKDDDDEKEASDTSTSSSSDCTRQHQHHHPFVGYVDHVSVMPLISPTAEQNVIDNNNTVGDECNRDFQPTSASGMAARAIGKALEQASTIDDVFYYGDAHPFGTPLATVRRERTRFFQTGGFRTEIITKSDISTAQLTVGAPPQFVENFNIRLTRHVSKAMAQSLTRHVRERDGGLVNVEALTLPYSRGRWEVACNLVRPNTSTTARQAETAVQDWESRQRVNSLRTMIHMMLKQRHQSDHP